MKFFVFIFLLLPSILGASEIDPNWQVELVEDYSGGMNNNIQGNKLSNKFSPFISNLLVDEVKGQLVQFQGTSVIGATSTLSSINFLKKLSRENEQDIFYLSDSSQVLSTTDFQSYRFVRGGLNTASLLSGVQVRDKMWFTNGNDSVFTDNGSTVTVLDGRTYSGLATPCVPKGKYIAYDQNIPWLANSTFSLSAVHFAALTDTSGNAIAPDNSAAWPLTNQLNVNQGDGFPVTSLWSYNGLYVGKQNAIYKRSGIDADTYRFDQTRAEAGPISNDSVAHGDNLTYFKGYQGAYKFNGSEAVRFTDGIQDDMDLVENNVTQIVKNVWDTSDDFRRGTIGGGTFTASGIQVSTRIYLSSNDGSSPQQLTNFNTDDGSTTTGHIAIDGQVLKDSDFFNASLASLRMAITDNSGNCTFSTFTVTFKNLRTNIATSTAFILPVAGDVKSIAYEADDLLVTRDDIRLSSFVYKIDVYDGANEVPPGNRCNVTFSSIGAVGTQELSLYNTTAQYMSEISTIASITAWDKLDGIQDNDGGSLSYFVRTATNVAMILNKVWTPIVFGGVINSTPSQNYVQWASTMLGGSISSVPEIDKVTIAHNEGGLLETRPIAVFWNNRYWLGVTTVTSGSTSIFYVKSKISNENPDAIVRRDGLSIRSLLNANDIFYAGSSTGGVILRLDSGNLDNGRAINFFYDTPEFSGGHYFITKQPKKFIVEAESEQSLNLFVDFFVNGALSSTRTITMDSSGRQYRELQGLSELDFKYLKVRIAGSNSGERISLGSLALYYLKTRNFRE